jgi:uncharacterized protein YrzB (UPF0473 family)
MAEKENTIVLLDEEGKEFEFHVVDVIEVDGSEYAILLPADEDVPEEAEVLRIDKDESGQEILVQVEDDEEWERVAQAWEELVNEWEDEEWEMRKKNNKLFAQDV